MLGKNEEIYEVPLRQIRFEYPFHKVSMNLFKKAVEDFILFKLSNVEVQEETNQ